MSYAYRQPEHLKKHGDFPDAVRLPGQIHKFRLVLDKCVKMHILFESAHGEVPKWPKGLPC